MAFARNGENLIMPVNPAQTLLEIVLGDGGSKSLLGLDSDGRKTIAAALKKDSFANSLALLPVPRPHDPLYPWLQEILTTNIVYDTNKKADEEWMRALNSDEPTEYVPALNHLSLLKAQIDQYRESVEIAQETLESNRSLTILENVRVKYRLADEQHFKDFSNDDYSREAMIKRVATRLTYFSGIQVSSDLDLTMTSAGWYLALLPHFLQFENFMSKNGRETLPFVMARYAREALIVFENLYKKVGSVIPLRPGVKEFFRLTKEMGIPVSILSANFKAIVVGCLEQISLDDRKHLLEITGLQTNDITAAHKDITTAKRVTAFPDLANLLCLDGLSDQSCLEGSAEGVSAGIFVLAGTKFATIVKESGQPYFEFEDFHYINSTIMEIIQQKDSLIRQGK